MSDVSKSKFDASGYLHHPVELALGVGVVVEVEKRGPEFDGRTVTGNLGCIKLSIIRECVSRAFKEYVLRIY